MCCTYLPAQQENDTEVEDEVDILMSSDIMAAQMSTKKITFDRAQSGWFFKDDKTVSYDRAQNWWFFKDDKTVSYSTHVF